MPHDLFHPAGVGELSFNERRILLETPDIGSLSQGSFPQQIATLTAPSPIIATILDDPVLRFQVLRLNIDPSPQIDPLPSLPEMPGSPLTPSTSSPVGGGVMASFLRPETTSVQTRAVQSAPGGQAMGMFAGGIMVAPRLMMALKMAAHLTNRAGAMRLGPISGGGVFKSIIAALAIDRLFDLPFFGSSAEDELQGLVEELMDSGYILWDPVDRRGNDRTMEYIVIPVGQNSQREQAYGMAYRPFSRSSIRKRDQSQDTYRRPTRARRYVSGTTRRSN